MSVSHQYVLKHYKELVKTPLPNVGVAPKEDNFKEWHVNFFFPDTHEHFPGLILHFQMTFPDAYPASSPNVVLFNLIKHSHVHGTAVCFSLLPDFRGFFQATSTPQSAYWNPARTARSFLEDLYTFLLVDDDKHVTILPHDTDRALSDAKTFQCACGHTFTAPTPACPDLSQQNDTPARNAALNGQEPSGESDNEPVSDLSASTIEDLRCSITRSLFLDQGVVMGFGVNVVHLPGGKLQIDTDLSPMSSQAFFDQNIKVTADGNSVTHFVPYVINAQHFSPAAQRILAQTVASITDKKNINAVNGLLLVLGEIWKSKAVMLMAGREHASEKALKGFCAIHHLLLSCSRYMPLIETASKKVKDFIESPDNATKDKVPDLGQFLTFFLLSTVAWNGPEKAGSAVVRELFNRNALWITKAVPTLSDVAKHKSDRVEQSWEPSSTGLKLVALQIRFMLALPAWATSYQIGLEAGLIPGAQQADQSAARPDGTAKNGTAEAGWGVLHMYNRLGGRPTEDMLANFQLECKRVQDMKGYNDFFGALGLGMPAKQQCHDMLEAAMQRSALLGYHGRGGGGGRGGYGGGRGGYVGGGRGRR